MSAEKQKYSFRKVLAIEDTKIDQYIIENTMKKCNFSENLVLLGSANEALSLFENINGNDEELPELMFLDIQMPRMNGFEFLKTMDEKFGRLKDKITVVLLTSSLDPIDKATSIAFPNVKLYINKPLNIEKLNKVTELFC